MTYGKRVKPSHMMTGPQRIITQLCSSWQPCIAFYCLLASFFGFQTHKFCFSTFSVSAAASSGSSKKKEETLANLVYATHKVQYQQANATGFKMNAYVALHLLDK